MAVFRAFPSDNRSVQQNSYQVLIIVLAGVLHRNCITVDGGQTVEFVALSASCRGVLGGKPILL